MEPLETEDNLLRSAALQNAKSIRLARQRTEQGLVRAKEDLELKTRELAYSLALMRRSSRRRRGAGLIPPPGRITRCPSRAIRSIFQAARQCSWMSVRRRCTV